MNKKTIVGLAAAAVLGFPFLAYATTNSEQNMSASGKASFSAHGSVDSNGSAPTLPGLPGGGGSNPLQPVQDQLQKGQQQLEGSLAQGQEQLEQGLQQGQEQLQNVLYKLQPSSGAPSLGGGSKPVQPALDQLKKGLQDGQQQLENQVKDLQQELQNGGTPVLPSLPGAPSLPAPPAMPSLPSLPSLPGLPGSPVGGDVKASGNGGGQMTIPGLGTFSLSLQSEGSSQGAKSSLQLNSPFTGTVNLGN